MPLADNTARRSFRASQARLGKRYDAGPAVISRDHSVKAKTTDGPLSALALNGEHLITATSLSLKGAADIPIEGVIPAGLALTINAVEYAVASAATASGSLIAVTVAPGLASTQADDAVVTLAASASLTWPRSRVHWLSAERQLALRNVGNVGWVLRLAFNDAPTGAVPVIDDRILANSRTARVLSVTEPAGAWRCLMEA